MDGSSLPEPPQRDDGGISLRSLLARATADRRASNAPTPNGGNPFARFSQDGTRLDAFINAPPSVPQSALEHPAMMVPSFVPGMAPTMGPASAAGVRPPTGGYAVSAPSHVEDDMSGYEPTAKRQRMAGRSIVYDGEDEDVARKAPVSEPALYGGNHVTLTSGATGPQYTSAYSTDTSHLTSYNNLHAHHSTHHNMHAPPTNPQMTATAGGPYGTLPSTSALPPSSYPNTAPSAASGYATTAGGGYPSTAGGVYASTAAGGYPSNATGVYASTANTGVYASTAPSVYGHTVTGGYPSNAPSVYAATATGGYVPTAATGGYTSAATGGYVPNAPGGYSAAVAAAAAAGQYGSTAMAGHGPITADALRRLPGRLVGLQPTRPNMILHAGMPAPAAAFRSIGAMSHPHSQPLQTAAHHGPTSLATIATASGNITMGLQQLRQLAAGGVAGVGSPEEPPIVVSRRQARRGAVVQSYDDDYDDHGGTSSEEEYRETTRRAGGDAAEEVLQQVERISRSLRGSLQALTERLDASGNSSGVVLAAPPGHGQGAAGDAGGALQPGVSRPLVTAADIASAIGSEEVAARLKPYQLVGINYLLQLASAQVGGAILADEMGLGKTAQTCVYLACMRPLLDDPGPHLVVVPASLLQNWQRELKLWAPNLKVVTYYGPNREKQRHRIKRKWAAIAAGQEPGPDSDEEQPHEENEEGQESEDGGADADSGGGEEELDEDEVVEEDDYGRPRAPQRQTGKGGGCGGLFDVMLTTYTLWEREGPSFGIDRAFMSRWPWSHVVMDEAHALKNSSSTRSRKLRKVAQLAATRVMLTGTPLQNDLQELHALLAFLLPTIFTAGEGADALASQIAEATRPLPAGQAARAAAPGGSKSAEVQSRLVERMRLLLQPFILRRLKSEVADQLVAKQQHIVLLNMVQEQQALYDATVATMRDEVSKEVGVASPAGGPGGGRGRGRGRGRPRRGAAALAAAAAAANASPGGAGGGGPVDVSRLSSTRVQHIFTQLRKVAQHPLLVRARYSQQQINELAELAASRGLFGGGPTVERCLKELSTYSDHQLHCFALAHPKLLTNFILPTDAVLGSAKMQHLDVLLPKLKENGSRVLLFSQWTTVLDLLEWYLGLRGHMYCRLDGNTQVEDRLAMVDAFNAAGSPYFVFLLSTRAGGQGLNLTGADTVILHDVDFNPQIDKQAEDRAHRLGQTRSVAVYRLITRNSVDSNIQGIAERKLALDAAVLGDMVVGAGAEGGGRTGRGRGGRGRGGVSAADTRHMADILSSLLTGAPGSGAGGSQDGVGGGDGGSGSGGSGQGGSASPEAPVVVE